MITNLEIILFLTASIGGYLSGSVPYGLIVGQIFGVGDIRKTGSGNIGATNMLRAGGKKLAVITLLLDALKGFVPTFLTLHYAPDYAVITAAAAVLGHIFPIWLKGKGGKGVATFLGVSFGLHPFLGALLCLLWLMVAFLSKYSSLAALITIALAPLLYFFLGAPWLSALIMLMISLLIIYKHHENIKRLLNKTEPKIGAKAKASL